MSVKGGGGVPPKSVTFFLAKILSVKGGGGTPLTDKIRKVVFDPFPYRTATRQKFAENGVFRPKNTVFGPILDGFFLIGKGGYPPPPSRTAGSKKPNGKKLTERGGTPPPLHGQFPGLGFLKPSLRELSCVGELSLSCPAWSSKDVGPQICALVIGFFHF